MASTDTVWCRDNNGWFLPVMSHKNATCCHCFLVQPSSCLAFAICGSLAVLVLAGPEAGLTVWVFLRVA